MNNITFKDRLLSFCFCAAGAILGIVIGQFCVALGKEAIENTYPPQVVLYSPVTGLTVVHSSGLEDGKPVVYLNSKSLFRYLNPDGTIQGDDDLWAPRRGWAGDEFGVPITASVEKFVEKEENQ